MEAHATLEHAPEGKDPDGPAGGDAKDNSKRRGPHTARTWYVYNLNNDVNDFELIRTHPGHAKTVICW